MRTLSSMHLVVVRPGNGSPSATNVVVVVVVVLLLLLLLVVGIVVSRLVGRGLAAPPPKPHPHSPLSRLGLLDFWPKLPLLPVRDKNFAPPIASYLKTCRISTNPTTHRGRINQKKLEGP